MIPLFLPAAHSSPAIATHLRTTMPVRQEANANRAQAEAVVAKVDGKDPKAVQAAIALGDAAFDPALKAFLAVSASYDAKFDFAVERRFNDLIEVLRGVTGPKRAADLLATIKVVPWNSSTASYLLSLMNDVGAPAGTVRYLIEQLKIHPLSQTASQRAQGHTSEDAFGMILASSEPEATRYVLERWDHPATPARWREAIYLKVGTTGGAAVLPQVLTHRTPRRLLAPLETRMDLAHARAPEAPTPILSESGETIGWKPGPTTAILQERKDGSGKTWGLLQCGILGNGGDLWLAERVGERWTRPLFLGIALEPEEESNPRRQPQAKLAGKTAKELADGAWFAATVGKPEFARDRDKDGLTDRLGVRLGTNPEKQDTDGDGDLDAVDPWPNAPLRKLDDREQVLKVAFEARARQIGGGTVALFQPPAGMRPFEMVGWPGPVIWATKATEPLEACFGKGIEFLSFNAPGREGTEESRLFRWNADRTEATLSFGNVYGSLGGNGVEITVRKIGGEWIAVEVRDTWIS